MRMKRLTSHCGLFFVGSTEYVTRRQGTKCVFLSTPSLTITMDPFSCCLTNAHFDLQQLRQAVFTCKHENESLTCGQGLSLRSQMSLFCRCTFKTHCVYFYLSYFISGIVSCVSISIKMCI